MRPWDPLFDFVFVDCLAQVAACEIHHQSWCWSVFVFFFGAPQCRCFKWFSSFYQGYIRYISYKLSLLYLIVNCGVPILGESSSSLEEWRSLLGQSGCHGGERFSKEIWGQGVPWAETYGCFCADLLVAVAGAYFWGWMFAGSQPWSGLRAKREANTPVVGRLKELLIGWDPCNLTWQGIGKKLLGIRGKMPFS